MIPLKYEPFDIPNFLFPVITDSCVHVMHLARGKSWDVGFKVALCLIKNFICPSIKEK